jgi:hypothetical protein
MANFVPAAIRAYAQADNPANTFLKSFHEKAGMSQVCFSLSVALSVFSFLPVNSLHSSQAASVAILPSALLVERFSLGAWWAFPIQ